VTRPGRHRAARSGWFHGAPLGRPTQTPGRRTAEYMAQKRAPMVAGQPFDGMAPVGAAGRQTLEDLWAGPGDRGGRHDATVQMPAVNA
jgi:hypothetical protein